MKTTKRIISVLLVLVLITSICSSAFAEEEKPLRYLAIGDSTSNGYLSDEYKYQGMRGVNCGKNPYIYPNLMGQYLREKLDREVEVECILPEGIRAHDLRAVLDPDFVGDDYCMRHIKGWYSRYGGSYESTHKTFCDAIENADIMSIDVCMSSLGNYCLDRAKCAIGMGDGTDYDKVYGSDLLSSYLADGKYGAIVKAVTGLRSKAVSMLKSAGIPADAVTKVLDAYEYSAGTLMINLTECIERIYELNDDIELIVMSPFTTNCYDITLAFGGVSISIGAIMHLYMCVVYDYLITLEPNRDRYKLADMYHTFLSCYDNAIANGEWDRYTYVTEEVRKLLLDRGVPVAKDIPEQDEYFRNTALKNFGKALADTEFALTLAPFELIKMLIDGDEIANSLVKSAADDYDNATPTAQLALKLVYAGNILASHPDYAGHQQKFEAMKKVYEKQYTAKYTYLTSTQDTIYSFLSTVMNGDSVLGFIKNLTKISRLGVFSPRLFIK